MSKRFFIAASLLLTGCAVMPPISGKASLVLTPQILAGSRTQSQVLPYTQSSVDQLVLKLYTVNGGEHDTGIQKTLVNAQLGNPVVVSNLKPQTTYRIKGYAYAGAQLISVDGSDSYTDIVVTDGDRPTLGTLKVKLCNIPFNAQASSSLTFNSGKYLPLGPEGVMAPNFGIVTTWAGNGVNGFTNAYPLASTFRFPAGIAVDSQGNVYIGDQSNHAIRKITPAGVVTTLAGNGTAGLVDGTGTGARLNGPNSMCIDGSGNLYVADRSNHCIRKITAGGVVTTLAGNGTAGFNDAQGTLARLSSPVSVARDAGGNLYVTDYGNQKLRKITPGGLVSTFAGNGATGSIDAVGTAAGFNGPHGITSDAQGTLFVADLHGHRIRKITSSGVVSTLVGTGVAGYLEGTGTGAQINAPWGIAVDSQGNVYVAEMTGSRIRKITPDGVTSTVAGNGTAGFADGQGTAARFSNPHGLAFDSLGNLYVAEPNNVRIRLIQ